MYARPANLAFGKFMMVAGDAWLFQVYLAVLKKVERDGFVVPDDMRLSMDEFCRRYGPSRERMALLFYKRIDPGDKLYVFWCNEPKMTIKAQRPFIERMTQESVFHAIILTQEPGSGYARDVAAFHAPRYFIVSIMERDIVRFTNDSVVATTPDRE